MLEHVEAVALRLDQVGVGVVDARSLASEAPRGEHRVAGPAVIDGPLRVLHGTGVAVIEVDGEEQILRRGFGQERVRLRQVEHERLLARTGYPARSTVNVGS